MAVFIETPAVVVGTWPFSAQPVKVAARLAREGKSCVECLEKALNVAEEDERYGVYQVGRGGPPNEKGEVELDAAIMCGHDLSFGAVTALQRIGRASSVARCVMEKSPHSMLTSQGAQDFAVHCGFKLDTPPPCIQGSAGSHGSGEGRGSRQGVGTTGGKDSHFHDTLGLLVLDLQGNVAAGVTTSGMSCKARGRIGDSALPGSGLYADSKVGAVCCSGEGDEIMKFCPSFLVLENMRQGMLPGTACESAIKRIRQRIAPSPMFELVIIAVSVKGDVGAAGTVKEWKDPLRGERFPGFPFMLWNSGNEGDPKPSTLVVSPV